MQQIQIDLSGVGGLTPSYAKVTPNLNYIGADNEVTQGSYNPFVFPGYMAPARSMARTLDDAGANQMYICRAAYYDPIYNKLVIGGAEVTTNNGAITVWDNLDAGTFAQSAELGLDSVVYDFEVYQLNGVRKIFFSTWNSGTGYIGVLDVSNSSNYNTYNWSNGAAAANATLYTGTVSGSTTFTFPPFMRVATNGFMYAFSANRVYKIDGTSAGGTAGTITGNALTLDAAYKISDAVDWRNLMFIAVQDADGSSFGQPVDARRYANICGVYVWDRVTTQVSTRDYIPLYGVKYVNRIFVAHDGKLRMITTGSDGYTQLREYNGSEFVIIQELGTYAAPLFCDSLTISDYATFWLGQDNYIYAHGKPLSGSRNAIYKLGQITSSAIPSGYHGFLLYADYNVTNLSEALFVNYSTNSANASVTKKILFNHSSTPTNYTSSLPGTADATIVKNKVTILPFLCNIVEAKVFFATTTSSGAGDETDVMGVIKVFLNQSTTAFKSYSVTKKDLRKGYAVIPINKQYINSIQFGIDWTTVTSVGNISGLTNDMMTWYALLEYKPTNTRK